MKTYRQRLTKTELVQRRRRRAAKQNGDKGQDETAEMFRKALEDLEGVSVEQRSQAGLGGKGRPDIAVCLGRYEEQLAHVENKRDKRRPILAAFRQACRDHKPGVTPMAVAKYPQGPEILVIHLHEFLPMFRAWVREQIQ